MGDTSQRRQIHAAPPCQVCKSHNPKPITTDAHHIRPESWGGLPTADNLVQVCNTVHHGAHALIDLYVQLGRAPSNAEMRAAFGGVLPSKGMRDLAARAWAQRPPTPTPTSLTFWPHG